MAWTATVIGISTNEANIVARVNFVQAGETITRDVPAQDLSPESLAAYCQRVIIGLEARDAGRAALKIGAVTLPRDATDQPTKDKLAAIAAADGFFLLLGTHNGFQLQIAKGILKADDPAATDAAAAMKAAFLPEYASDPRFR